MYVTTHEVEPYILGKIDGNWSICLWVQIHTKVISKIPSISHLCLLSCVSFAHVPKERQGWISNVSNAYWLDIMKN